MPKRIVIIAGEESGDVHSARLIKKLRLQSNELIISGIGGKHMEAEGVILLCNLAQYGVTGLTEVVRHARVIRQAFTLIKKHLTEHRPDLLILVDYPGFNLRLAKFAKEQLNLKILYYISPQIWAWKAGRIHTIKKYVDSMAVIFPFEKSLYTKAAVPAYFVGHPLVDAQKTLPDQHCLRSQFNVPTNKKIIALLPGSRMNEISRLLPVMCASAQSLYKEMPDIHFIIPIAKTVSSATVRHYFAKTTLPITYTDGQAVEVAAASDCIVVASGTASLECALLLKPMCIIYKSSLITYIAAMKLMKVKYLGLCNLLENKMIVPELLQYDCNPSELTATIRCLLNNSSVKKNIENNLLKMKNELSSNLADCKLEDLVLNHLI